MKKNHVTQLIICAAFASAITPFLVNAVEPMSESDMGDVSAVSGDILNVMGSPAAGDESPNPNNPQLDSSKDDAKTRISYTEAGAIDTNDNPDLTLTPSESSPEDNISTFRVSDRTDGELGASTLYYDEKENHNSSEVVHKNQLTLNQDVRVQRVDIIQSKHSIDSTSRGDIFLNDIQVNGSTSIIAR